MSYLLAERWTFCFPGISLRISAALGHHCNLAKTHWSREIEKTSNEVRIQDTCTRQNKLYFTTVCATETLAQYNYYPTTSRVPVQGKSPVCLICMKYRIIFFYYYQPGSNIIIVYCKHITHARTHARTNGRTRVRTHPRQRVDIHPHTHTAVAIPLFDGSVPANRDGPLRWWQ